LESAERMSPAWWKGSRPNAVLDLLARMVMVGGFCFVLSWAAVMLTRTSGSVAAIWPATGILLVVLLRSKPVRWPAFLLAGYISGCGANLVYGDNLFIATALPLGNVIETLVAAILLRRCFPQGVDLSEARQLAALVVIGMLAATACGATIGAIVLDTVQSGNFWRTWFNWWTAVGTGILLIVPLVLTWRSALDDAARVALERPAESVLAILCTALGVTALFSQETISLLVTCPASKPSQSRSASPICAQRFLKSSDRRRRAVNRLTAIFGLGGKGPAECLNQPGDLDAVAGHWRGCHVEGPGPWKRPDLRDRTATASSQPHDFQRDDAVAKNYGYIHSVHVAFTHWM